MSAPQCPLTADLPCNEKGADYSTLANQASAHLLSEIVNFDEDECDKNNRPDCWKSLTEKKGVKIFVKTDQFTKQRIYLCYTMVKCSRVGAMDFIINPDTRFRYDNMMKENFILERFSEGISFCYSLLQTKNCIAQYMIDLCYLTTSRTEGNRSVIAYTSILDHPKAPSSAGIERAWLYHSGFVMEPWEEENNEVEVGEGEEKDKIQGIKLFYLTHIDMVIDLPAALKRLVEEKQCLIIAYLRQCLESLSEDSHRYKSSSSLNEPRSYFEEGEFKIQRLPSQVSLDMNLEPTSMTPAASSLYQGSAQRAFGRSYCEPSPPIANTGLNPNPIPGIMYSGSGSQPDLCFWSIDDDVDGIGADSLEYLSDYVTMANSAAASLFREYINIIETIRFSNCCPEKLIWRVLERNDEMWVLEKKGSTIQCMAGVANIRATEREVTDFVSDPRSRFSFDPTLHKTYVVDEINENLRIIYNHHRTKHCFVGHGRDILYFAYNRKEGDRRILAHASCTHPKCPEDPKITRAKMYETGFIIEPLPEPGLTNIVYVIKIDMQGTVPHGLMRALKIKQPHVLFAIKKYFER